MKMLALNSSPRSNGESKTEIMLNSLVAGMREAGAMVEVVSLSKKKIKPCAGCFSCWTRTPGTCIHKDDMTKELFPQWLESDLVVYASPLYHFTVNAVMKAFIERTLPVLEPFFDRKNGQTFHPLRNKAPKVVMLSVAGFPEVSVFDQLSSWTNFIYGTNSVHESSLVAEIYRPMAGALTLSYFKDTAAKILEATQQAGREIATSMHVSEETMARIKQPMVEEPGIFLNLGNMMWKTCISKGITPKEFGRTGLIPRPESIDSYIDLMRLSFNAKEAKDFNAKIQFNFSGDNQGSCFFTIAGGTIDGQLGTVNQPELIVNTPFEIWMDIITGKVDGQQMFMEEKYAAEGDLSFLMQMNQLFGSNA